MTICPVIYARMYIVDDERLSLLYGRSYLDYIPRTLPQFILPDRPAGMEWIFSDYGETSGGGIFELAEAFANFGMLGVIVIPSILTFIFGRVYVNSIVYRTHFWFMCYVLVRSLFFRRIWYQKFSFYKTVIVWLIVEGFIVVFAGLKRNLDRLLPRNSL